MAKLRPSRSSRAKPKQGSGPRFRGLSGPESGAPFRALVFDLDGTLVDSAPDIRTALNRTLAESDLKPVSLASVRAMIGDGAETLVARGYRAHGVSLEGKALAKRYARFIDFYQGRGAAMLTRPYPGVVATLERLARAGFRLGLCTNKPAIATEAVLAHLGLAHFFAATLSSDEVASHKPDPAHLRAVLAALGVGPREAAMVGDNRHDVDMAHGAGVVAIAVAYGYAGGPPADLGADLLIERFDRLPAALKRLAARKPLP
ncbi:MAG TPA: phosphoglycolate phosphatase [Alphaproteobacteria bacterium]|nr:phosphoglycolate phosphatase [Alphaproteobacteria bacterium]